MITTSDFFDAILKRTGVKNDRALARLIDVDPCSLSNMRAGRAGMGPTILLRVHEATAIPIAELKALAGCPPFRRG
jgi:DNA-binding transcriptional regulator YdaS (Cro superfamily)